MKKNKNKHDKAEQDFHTVMLKHQGQLIRQAIDTLVKEEIPFSTELVTNMIEEEEHRLLKSN